jgi:hypothetical protein
MANYYLITTFVVLLAGVEVANKAQPGVGHLPDQGATTIREGRLAHQRSGGMGRDVRVVGVHRVQSPLRAEPTQPMEQCVGAALCADRGWYDILFLCFHKFFMLTCL